MGMRRYYSDDDTGRLFFVDNGEEPDGVFVEEIEAWEFYRRSSITLSCGWPANHWPNERGTCPCGRMFPDLTTIGHKTVLSADDEALL